jgi:hypothetical protein
MRLALLLSAFTVFSATSALAQNASAACDGDITVIRVSTIKPGGSLQQFLEAVAANKAWYRANGVNDNDIFAARELVRDSASGTMKYSDTEVLTYHVRPPARARVPNRGDAAWNAFVKLFQENSEIKTEYQVCVPKPADR